MVLIKSPPVHLLVQKVEMVGYCSDVERHSHLCVPLDLENSRVRVVRHYFSKGRGIQLSRVTTLLGHGEEDRSPLFPLERDDSTTVYLGRFCPNFLCVSEYYVLTGL